MGECFITRRGGAGGLRSQGMPEFTYTGTYQTLDDGDGNWRIKFLTSGNLTFTKISSAIDVFVVGGGGGSGGTVNGGAGGGYTNTEKNVAAQVNTPYTITIGAGGASKANGGTTTAFNISAGGGKYPTDVRKGADGGSGGGSTAYNSSSAQSGRGGDGGRDGSDGGSVTKAAPYNSPGGTGQHTTTREFGDPDGQLYAGGGAGGYDGGANEVGVAYDGGGAVCESGQPNTGGGAGGGYKGHWTTGTGGSGIVIIRNARR